MSAASTVPQASTPSKHATSRPRRGLRRRALFLPIILLVAIGLQIPIVWALGRLGGHLLPIVAATAGLTGAFIWGFLGGRLHRSPGRARLFLVVWPFFIWWTVALLFALILPFALVARVLFHGSVDAALMGAVAAAVLATIVALRQRARVRSQDVFVSGLPEAFEEYRIVQISDLHCGPFVSGDRVADWVAATNRLDPDLIAVTGDLIANGPDFVPVVAAELGKLAARDGVFASMGNHDYFTDGDALVHALESAGLVVLRNRGVQVRRGGDALYVAGVDDTWTRRHDMGKALSEHPPGTPVLLLAHDPALFPEAAARGVDLTLSGHTHGGQLGIPFFARRFNMARLTTAFTTGLYQTGRSTLYVNRGLGTTGPPIRIGVAPEIAVLTLRRAREHGAALPIHALPP